MNDEQMIDKADKRGGDELKRLRTTLGNIKDVSSNPDNSTPNINVRKLTDISKWAEQALSTKESAEPTPNKE